MIIKWLWYQKQTAQMPTHYHNNAAIYLTKTINAQKNWIQDVYINITAGTEYYYYDQHIHKWTQYRMKCSLILPW
jgi:hypothetical protein